MQPTPDPTYKWVWSAPEGAFPEPPIATKAPLLPLEQLTWPNAERLFVRLLEEVMPTESVKLYGEPGQQQAGIDLYGRLRTPESAHRSYISLQSKRVSKQTPALISGIVEKFLTGEWAQRSARFFLATTTSLTATKLDEAVRAATDRLSAEGIEFTAWGREEVSELLRTRPEIVDDFFGRPWVELFCGAEAAASLKSRLTRDQFLSARSKLNALYLAELDVPQHDTPADSEQFVVLDVSPLPIPDEADVNPESEPTPIESPEEYLYPTVAAAAFRNRPTLARRPASRIPVRSHAPLIRVPADEALEGHRLNLLVGAPGSGKSSLLQFIVSDLARTDKQLWSSARVDGMAIPIWLPFTFLCRHLGESSEHSITSAAIAWVTSRGIGDIAGLVATLMEDTRLLLVVDGIDEWTDATAANYALALIESHLQRTGAGAILSTRPYALSQLSWGLPWTRHQLASLSDEQRSAVVRRELLRSGSTSHLAAEQTKRFIEDLEHVSGLADLARFPLFLVLLATHWEGEPLPPRRLMLYAKLTELLIKKHPMMRRRASLAADPSLDPEDALLVFGAVAFRERAGNASGVFEKAALSRAVTDALEDPYLLGLDHSAAVAKARAVLADAEKHFGLLASQGGGNVGFIHRVIYEHLAGDHLARMPLEVQRGFFAEHSRDSSWHDVLLSALASQIRKGEVAVLLEEAVRDCEDTSRGSSSAFELVAEALAAGVALTPLDLAQWVTRLADRVETHPLLEHRAAIARSLSAAMVVPATRNVLTPMVKRWLTAHFPEPNSAIWALRSLPLPDEPVATTLLWGLRNGDDNAKINAAEAIAVRFGGDDDIRDRLEKLALLAGDSATQASALFALGHGWKHEVRVAPLLSWGRRQDSFPVRIVALTILNETLGAAEALTPEDRAWLRRFLRDERWSGRVWVGFLRELLEVAVKGHQESADFALQTLRENGRNGGDRDLAWYVACTAFAADERFRDWTESELRRGKEGLILQQRSLIPDEWYKSPSFREAAEMTVEAQARSPISAGDLAPMARRLVSPTTRDALLRALSTWRPLSAARALLHDYPEDPAVELALRERFHSDFASAAPLAPLAIEVLGIDAGWGRLSGLLREAPADSHDEGSVVVASAVAQAWLTLRAAEADPNSPHHHSAKEIVRDARPAELAGLATQIPTNGLRWHIEWIIRAWPEEPAVVAYANRLLDEPQEPHEGIPDPTPTAILMSYSGSKSPESTMLVQRVLDTMGFLGPQLREVVVAALADAALPVDVLADVLSHWRVDPDLQVRKESLLGLAKASMSVGGSPAAVEWVRSQIRSELVAYGPDLDERRQLGWTAMLLIGDLSLHDQLMETLGDPVPPAVGLHEHYDRINVELVELVAMHWEELQSKFGETLAAMLSGRKVDNAKDQVENKRMWEALATVADRYPALAKSITADTHRDGGPESSDAYSGKEVRFSALLASLETNSRYSSNALPDEVPTLLDTTRWSLSKDELANALCGDTTVERLTGWPRFLFAQLFPKHPASTKWFGEIEATFLGLDSAERWEWTDVIGISLSVAPPAELAAIAMRIHGRLHELDDERPRRLFTYAFNRRLLQDAEAEAAALMAIRAPGVATSDSAIFAGRVSEIGDAGEPLIRQNFSLGFLLNRIGLLPAAEKNRLRAEFDKHPSLIVVNPITGAESPLILAASLLD